MSNATLIRDLGIRRIRKKSPNTIEMFVLGLEQLSLKQRKENHVKTVGDFSQQSAWISTMYGAKSFSLSDSVRL